MSFDEFYRAYARRVRGLAAREFGEADADDIAQEAMFRAYRDFHRLSDPAKAWPWLVVVTRHAGVDFKRAKQRLVAASSALIEELSPPLPDQPATTAQARDTFGRVGAVLRRITEPDRRAFALHEIEDIPVAEVAVMCGTTANAIRQRLFRARRVLARELTHLSQPAMTAFAEIGRRMGHVAEVLSPVTARANANGGIAFAVALSLLFGNGPAAPPLHAVPAPRATERTGRTEPAASPERGGTSLAAGLRAPVRDATDDTRAEDPAYQYTWRQDCFVTRGLDQYCTFVGPDGRDEPPGGVTHRAETVPATDGTPLRADVLLPDSRSADERHPVILAIGPRFDDDATRFAFPELWLDGHVFDMPRRYAYVQVGLRGRGGSPGCADFGGPTERADVAAAVEWAASQRWSSGRVALWGVSYWGWAALMGVTERPAGLAAAVVGAGVVTPGLTAAHGGVPLVTAGWPVTHHAVTSPGTPSLTSSTAGCADAVPPVALAGAYWTGRDLVPRLAESDVPVLWSHGFTDRLATPANLPARGDQPRWRGFLGQFGHGFPSSDRWFTEAMHWLDHHLGVASRPAYDGIEVQQGPHGSWRREAVWPPVDAVPLALPLNAGRYGDRPGNYGAPDNAGDGTCTGRAVACGAGVWTVGEALPHDAHLAGAVRVQLSVDAVDGATVVILLYDIGPRGAVLVTRGAALVRGGRADVSSYPQDWRLAAGHRLGALVTGADGSWYLPAHTGTEVDVLDGTLTVPFMTYDRVPHSRPGDIADIAAAFDVPADRLATATRSWPVPPRLRPSRFPDSWRRPCADC